MTAAQLKAVLNAIFLLGDRLYLGRDGCFQCSNIARTALIDVVLDERSHKEIGGGGKRSRLDIEVPIPLPFFG